jgi:hypothetical protein
MYVANGMMDRARETSQLCPDLHEWTSYPKQARTLNSKAVKENFCFFHNPHFLTKTMAIFPRGQFSFCYKIVPQTQNSTPKTRKNYWNEHCEFVRLCAAKTLLSLERITGIITVTGWIPGIITVKCFKAQSTKKNEWGPKAKEIHSKIRTIHHHESSPATH